MDVVEIAALSGQGLDGSGAGSSPECAEFFDVAERVAARPQLPPEAQEELGKLISGVIALGNHPRALELHRSAIVAATALEADPPRVPIAARIRRELAAETRVFRNPARVLARSAPSTLMLAGLIASLFSYGLLVLAGSDLFAALIELDEDQTDLSRSEMVYVAIFGAMGSVISVLMRTIDLRRLRGLSGGMMFLVGFTRPAIGVGFALFAYLLIRSDVLAIEGGSEASLPFVLAVAFVAGFSERFGDRLVQRAGDVVVAAPAKAEDEGPPEQDGTAAPRAEPASRGQAATSRPADRGNGATD